MTSETGLMPMKLYHITMRSKADSIQTDGFQDLRDGNYCDGGVWFSDQPYWDEDVFTEAPRSEYGYFTIDVDESQVETYKAQNEALHRPEWQIPFGVVNLYFKDRTFYPLSK